MHLEELFQLIEQNRREFIAKRASEICCAVSAVEENEPVLVQVGAGDISDVNE